MKVKSDHRSKFSNLNNWKEEAWKNAQFVAINIDELVTLVHKVGINKQEGNLTALPEKMFGPIFS